MPAVVKVSYRDFPPLLSPPLLLLLLLSLHVLQMGFFADAGPLQIFVSSHVSESQAHCYGIGFEHQRSAQHNHGPSQHAASSHWCCLCAAACLHTTVIWAFLQYAVSCLSCGRVVLSCRVVQAAGAGVRNS
jgi:ribosomal protein S27E